MTTRNIWQAAAGLLRHARLTLPCARSGRLVLTMMMMLMMTAQTVWADSAFSGGSGSKDNPYKIATTADLNQLATDVNGGNDYEGKYFELANDITYDYTSLGATESNYTAIGGLSHQFNGHFDGNDKTISGIRIYKGSIYDVDNYQGIFGLISSKAEVRNVILDDTRITGYKAVGGIVGRMSGSTVENCHVLSNVTIHAINNQGTSHGGIVGENLSGSVTGCTSAASITIADGITSCYYYGGIIGQNTGNVNQNTGNVSNCLYLGNTLGGSAYVGAIAGFNDGGNVSNCYYTEDTITGKKLNGDTLENDICAVGHTANNGPVTDCGLAYILTLGEGITCDALTVGNYTVATYSQTVTLANTATGAPSGYQYGFIVKDASDKDVTAGILSGTTLTMASFAVTVSSNTGILLSTHQAVSVSYVLADGTAQIASAIALDGMETSFDISALNTWYFVGIPTVNFDQKLSLSGSVDLILADGCTMNIGTSESRINSDGINGNESSSINIYGQSSGNGTLSVFTTGTGIKAACITINGGHVIVNSSGNALYATESYVTINGGTVEAIASSANAICAKNEFYFYGGNVTTSAPKGKAIKAVNYNFSWLNPADCIIIGSTGLYANDTDPDNNYNAIFGKPFTDGTTTYSTILTGETALATLTDKTFYPYVESFDLGANAHDGNYWTTFYCGHTGYKIDDGENAWAYTAEYDATKSQLTLHKLGKVIPKQTAVILVGSDNSISMTASTETVTVPTNNLHGVDVRMACTDITTTGTLYVMGKQGNDFGFFKYTGDDMPARKAYLLIDGDGDALANGLKMVFDDETTSLTPVPSPKGEGSDYWYTLSGTCLSTQPTQPGLYINNGKKVVVK